MQYAHTHGVVHRDLKPANILMSGTTPKIADFGLAKRMDSGQAHTATGTILGTPSYMSPEQAAGKTSTVGPASDIYSLGAILYECLTGRPPFRGATALETVLQVAGDDPVPPRRLRPETPPDLQTICLKCLAKDPRRRYGTAQLLADDLRRFAAKEPISARPATRWERARLWARRHPARAALYATLAGAAIVVAALGIRHNIVLDAAYQQIQAEHSQARQQLIRRTVASGSRLVDDGDFLGSLPWFVEALRLDDDPERDTIHRVRIAAVLRMCPQLLLVAAHEAPVIDAVIRPDGRSAAAARDDGSVRMWELGLFDKPLRLLREGNASNRFRSSMAPHHPLSFDPTGHWLSATLTDGLFALDASGQKPPTVVGDRSASAAWIHSGGHLLVAEHNRLTVWDVESAKSAGAPIPFDGSPIVSVAADASSQHVATGHQNGEIRLWELATQRSSAVAMKMPGPVIRLQFRTDGRRLLAAGGDAAQNWNVETERPATPPLFHAQTITDAAFSPNGSTVATSSIDDTARLWDAETGQAIADPLKHGSDVFRVVYDADGRLVATCSDDNTTRVWNVRTGLQHVPPLPHSGSTTAAAFGPRGRVLLTASEDGTVKLWRIDPPSDSPRTVAPPLGLPRRVPLGHDGRYELVSVDEKQFTGAEGEFRVYDSAEKRWILPGIVHPGGVLALDANSAGTLVATAGNDRTARLWDWRTGKEVVPPMRHGSRVVDVVFSPTGDRVATASEDNSARIWTTATGESAAPYLWHTGAVRHVRFNPDGQFLLTAGKTDLAYIWEVVSGEEVAPVRIGEPWVAAALATRHPSVTWNLGVETRKPEELMLLAQWLSGHRVEPSGGLAPLTAGDYERLAPQVRPLIPPLATPDETIGP
jgi:WD40 repeat protein